MKNLILKLCLCILILTYCNKHYNRNLYNKNYSTTNIKKSNSFFEKLFYGFSFFCIKKAYSKNDNYIYSIPNNNIKDIFQFSEDNILIDSNTYATNLSNLYITQDESYNIKTLFNTKSKKQNYYNILYGRYKNNSFNHFNISFGNKNDIPIKILNWKDVTFIIGNSDNKLSRINSKFSFILTFNSEEITNNYLWYDSNSNYKILSSDFNNNNDNLAIISRVENKNNPEYYKPLISYFLFEDLISSFNITDKIGGNLNLYDIIYSNDNSIIIVGSDQSIPTLSNPIIIKLKLDKEIWSKQIYFTSNTKNNPMNIINVIEDKINFDIYTLGLITDKFKSKNLKTLPWITKFDKNGNLIWLKAINIYSTIFNKLQEFNEESLILMSVLQNYTNILSIISKNGNMNKSFNICPLNTNLNISNVKVINNKLLFSGILLNNENDKEIFFGEIDESLKIGSCDIEFLKVGMLDLSYQFLNTDIYISKDYLKNKKGEISLKKYLDKNITSICNKETFSPTLKPSKNPSYIPTPSPTHSNNNNTMLYILIIAICSIVGFFCCLYAFVCCIYLLCKRSNKNKEKINNNINIKNDNINNPLLDDQISNNNFSLNNQHDFIVNDNDLHSPSLYQPGHVTIEGGNDSNK